MTPLRRMRPLLGTYVEAGATGPAAAALDAAFACIEACHRRWSFHDAGSELSRLNAVPGDCVPLHPHTLRLLRAARALMRMSEGAFDITVGGTLVAAGALPDHGGHMLARGCAEDIEVGTDWARLRRPVRLTLDGIAKGFAVDLACRAMRHAGADAGWINAGGDLRAFGGMTLPLLQRREDGSALPLGTLRNAAVATSRAGAAGDGSFPALIVAPDNAALPAGIWTVLAGSAWRADALAKVAAVTIASRRRATIAQLGGLLLETGESN